MIKLDTEIAIKRGDLYIKAFGILFTFLTIVIGLVQYFHTKSYDNKMEFKRNIWTKQLAVYSEASKYAGLIAMDPTGGEFQENVKLFGGLYWGEMILVEDKVVEKAMKDFYLAINDFHPEDEDSKRKLKFKANELAKACRVSSRTTWENLE